MSQFNPPPVAAQAIPYATPVQYYASIAPPVGGVWRDGRLLVMHKGGVLPDLCVKCGAPAHGFRVQRTFYWFTPWIYFAIPILLLFAVLTLVMRKELHTFLSLCPEHRAKRRNGLILWSLVSTVGFALPLVVGIAFAKEGLGFLSALSPIALIVGLIMLVLHLRILRPKKIDDAYAWLKGCGEPFLASLPNIQNTSAPHV